MCGGGTVADGITLQFNRGSSWKGNIYLTEDTCEDVGVDRHSYRRVVAIMEQFTQVLRSQGLVRVGVDFAHWNPWRGLGGPAPDCGAGYQCEKLTGAEFFTGVSGSPTSSGQCLCSGQSSLQTQSIGVILKTPSALLADLASADSVHLVTSVPGRWGIGSWPLERPLWLAASRVLAIERQLIAEGLAEGGESQVKSVNS